MITLFVFGSRTMNPPIITFVARLKQASRTYVAKGYGCGAGVAVAVGLGVGLFRGSCVGWSVSVQVVFHLNSMRPTGVRAWVTTKRYIAFPGVGAVSHAG